MGTTMPRRILDRFGINRIPQFKISIVCSYWARGKCNRNPCRLLHRLPAASLKRKSLEKLVASCNQKTAVEHFWGSGMKCDTSPCSSTDSSSSGFSEQPSVSSAHPTRKTTGLSTRSQPKKKHTQICTLWLKGNCANGDQCKYLHSWFRGEGFTMKTKLHGHLRDVTSLCLPSGSDKLYSGSIDGTVRVWDCHTGQSVDVIELGGGAEVGSLTSEGPWLFIGMPNTIRAWNTLTKEGLALDGVFGQVFAMVVSNRTTLFAGAQDGTVLAWKFDDSTAEPAKTLDDHYGAVVSLATGNNRLFSGSIDDTIKVWDLQNLQCLHTLTAHSGVVTSLIYWDEYLLSCSVDQTIKVWSTKDNGSFEVIYTHEVEQALLALAVMHDLEAKPILLCSCNDSSVRQYELPSFSERGRLFSKGEVRSIHAGPGGLFFTGDTTAQVTVWNWLPKPTRTT